MRDRLDGENRWTAVLSMDLVGFTAMAQQIGDEQVFDLLGQVLGLARKAIERQGGHVVDVAGDGILAVFGAPQALENASLNACKAALDFKEELAQVRPVLEQTFNTQVQFRSAIASGKILVARTGADAIKVVGFAVNKVSRLQDLAAPDETVISDTIQIEAKGYIETADRGLVSLKGFPEPVQIHSLVSLMDTPTTFSAKRRRGILELVGREAELERVRSCFADKAAPCAVVLRGPAGIGKSHLVHAIEHAIPRQFLTGQCQTSGRFPAYDPFIEICRQSAGAPWHEDELTILKRLLKNDPDLLADCETLYGPDQGRDQVDRALRLRSLFQRALHLINSERPAVFVVEDVHWIDPASLELLKRMVADGVQVLMTARPEFETDWLDATSGVVIDLSPLGQTEIAQIARATIDTDITDRVLDFVSTRAEGSPLVAEEIARALLQDGFLTPTEAGLDLFNEPAALLTGQLEQMVLTRLDRLDPTERDTLKYASAIGREFASAELDEALKRPVSLDKIARTPGLIENRADGRWQFVHALIRDAVYSSLLEGQKQKIHLELAEAIGTTRSEGNGRSGAMAAHYLRSSTPDKAAVHLIEAARQKLSVYGLHEIDDLLDQAYGLVGPSPDLVDDDTYAAMVVTWLRALDNMSNFSRAIQISERLLPRLERCGYSPALGISRTLRTIALAHAWKYDDARDLAMTTLKDAEHHKDDWGAAWAKVGLMRIFDESKKEGLDTIKTLYAEVMPVAQDTQDRQLAMTAQYLMCAAYRSAGFASKALKQANQIEEFAVANQDRRGLGYAQWARASVHIVESSYEKAIETISGHRDNIIPGSGDQRVCLGVEYFCRNMIEGPDVYTGQIKVLEQEAAELLDLNTAATMSFFISISDIQAGRLADGWDRLARLEGAVGTDGNQNAINMICAARSDILLAVAGLFDPKTEAPPGRKTHTRNRPRLRDIITFARLRPRAVKKAETVIQDNLSRTPMEDNPNYARFKIALGLIGIARKDYDRGRALLQEGLARAEREGLEVLAGRARRAIGGLKNV